MPAPVFHIGIDLDNTIICYDESFYKVGVQQGLIPEQVGSTKLEVKTYLTGLEGGQHQWETLQGMVYGKQINQASLFRGILKFIDAICAETQTQISIVSHKTIFAHHDPDQTNLRDAALYFLRTAKVIAPDRLTVDQVHFCDTLDEKVRTIAHLDCKIFIDDLAKVFEHPEFPGGCKAILFRGQNNSFQCCSSWDHVHHAVLT